MCKREDTNVCTCSSPILGCIQFPHHGRSRRSPRASAAWLGDEVGALPARTSQEASSPRGRASTGRLPGLLACGLPLAHCPAPVAHAPSLCPLAMLLSGLELEPLVRPLLRPRDVTEGPVGSGAAGRGWVLCSPPAVSLGRATSPPGAAAGATVKRG